MEPIDQPAETHRPVLVLDLPAEGHERHGAVKEDEQEEGKHPDPIDIVLPFGGISHVKRLGISPIRVKGILCYRAGVLFSKKKLLSWLN